MDVQESITETALKLLIDMHALGAVVVTGVPQGFMVAVRSDAGVVRTLRTVRGDVRRFASLDTAGVFLKALGVTDFAVDISGFRPGRLRSARPDRADALRKTRTKPVQQELV